MFKKLLKDNFEIAEYISNISTNEIDIEVAEEYFFGCFAVLKQVRVDYLKADNEDHHSPSKKKEKQYQTLPLKTMPPLVIENFTIIDGHHRYRALKRLGVKKIKVYEINHE